MYAHLQHQWTRSGSFLVGHQRMQIKWQMLRRWEVEDGVKSRHNNRRWRQGGWGIVVTCFSDLHSLPIPTLGELLVNGPRVFPMTPHSPSSTTTRESKSKVWRLLIAFYLCFFFQNSLVYLWIFRRSVLYVLDVLNFSVVVWSFRFIFTMKLSTFGPIFLLCVHLFVIITPVLEKSSVDLFCILLQRWLTEWVVGSVLPVGPPQHNYYIIW